MHDFATGISVLDADQKDRSYCERDWKFDIVCYFSELW